VSQGRDGQEQNERDNDPNHRDQRQAPPPIAMFQGVSPVSFDDPDDNAHLAPPLPDPRLNPAADHGTHPFFASLPLFYLKSAD
jgi:hypothetical protein